MFLTNVSKILSYIAAMIATMGILDFVLGDMVATGICFGVALVIISVAWIWETIIVLLVYRNIKEQERIDAEVDKLHE